MPCTTPHHTAPASRCAAVRPPLLRIPYMRPRPALPRPCLVYPLSWPLSPRLTSPRPSPSHTGFFYVSLLSSWISLFPMFVCCLSFVCYLFVVGFFVCHCSTYTWLGSPSCAWRSRIAGASQPLPARLLWHAVCGADEQSMAANGGSPAGCGGLAGCRPFSAAAAPRWATMLATWCRCAHRPSLRPAQPNARTYDPLASCSLVPIPSRHQWSLGR